MYVTLRRDAYSRNLTQTSDGTLCLYRMQERARRIARNFKPINYEEALPINAYINALDMTAL